MPQVGSLRGHDYDMPPPRVACLVQGTTWDLFCRQCGRHAYPNVIDLIERFGDSFTSDVIWRRATCRDCGARMKIAGGAFVHWLQKCGRLHRIVMPALADRPAF